MSSRIRSWTFTRRYSMFAFCLLGIALPAGPMVAAEPAAASLALVPQDAAAYSASLRLREQIEIVANSNFWKQLMEWDLVQQIKAEIEPQLQAGPARQAFEILEQPENQQLVQVLKEMFSDEIFSYAGKQTTGTIRLASDAVSAAQFAQMSYQFFGRQGDIGEEEFIAKAVFDTLANDLDNLAIPDFVVGFKIENKQPASKQLQRLEGFLTAMLQAFPPLAPLKDRFERKKIGESEFLTLSLDGSLVPWGEIPVEDIEEEAGQYDAVMKKLKELTLTVSLGIHDDFVLLSIAPSNDHLARLGKGPSIGDHPRLAVLKTKGDLRYSNVAFVSQELMEVAGTRPQDIDNFVALGAEYLPLAGLPADIEEKLLADLKKLGGDIKAYIPKPGPQFSYSFLTERGFEGYHHNWTENKTLDGSKPLTLIDHFGTSPILAVLARGQFRPGDYDLMVEWLRKGREYFEQFAVPQMSEREQKEYEKVAKLAYPLLARVDEVNRNMLLPAVADGQTGLVLDASLKTDQWVAQLPATGEPIAIPMPALIFGLKDADLFKKALGEYRAIINDTIKTVRQLEPDSVPEFELPAAKVRPLGSNAEVFYYMLPKELGVYNLIAPNIAVTKQMAILSLVPKHTKQIVQATPLKMDAGPLAKTDRNLAAAVYFDWAGTVDMIVPWVNEGVRNYARQQKRILEDFDVEPDGKLGAEGGSDMADMILAHVKKGASLLKVLRNCSSVTYVEDGALVTHTEVHIKDLK